MTARIPSPKPRLDPPMTGPTAPKRLDFLCASCGHTVATVTTLGKKARAGFANTRLNCPRCGARHTCEPILFADTSLVATHEWVQLQAGAVGLRAIPQAVGA